MNVRQDYLKDMEAFLKMIAANPRDVSARLVFADWLEEHGEPWAAFIRADIARAADNLEPTKRAELSRMAMDLYWKHHRYWNGLVYRQWIGTPLAGKSARAKGLRRWYYRQGMPEVLDVDAGTFVEYAELLLGAAPFREVYLRRPPQPVREFLLAHESILNRLETVVLATVPASDIPDLSSLPTGLLQRIRLGLRAQQTLPGHVSNPSNAPVAAPPPRPAAADRTTGNVESEVETTVTQANEREVQRRPTSSVLQILKNVWKRFSSPP